MSVRATAVVVVDGEGERGLGGSVTGVEVRSSVRVAASWVSVDLMRVSRAVDFARRERRRA